MDATGRGELGLQGRNEVKENREHFTMSKIRALLYTGCLQGPHQVNLGCSRLMVWVQPGCCYDQGNQGFLHVQGTPRGARPSVSGPTSYVEISVNTSAFRRIAYFGSPLIRVVWVAETKIDSVDLGSLMLFQRSKKHLAWTLVRPTSKAPGQCRLQVHFYLVCAPYSVIRHLKTWTVFWDAADSCRPHHGN